MITHRPILGWEGSTVLSVDDVFSSKDKIRGKCVLVADSTTYVIGAGTAEWLARNETSQVVLVTPHPHVSPELSNYNQLVYVLDRLNDAGIRVITISWIRKINPTGAIVFRISNPQVTEEVPADFVVLHTGRNQRGTLLRDLFTPLVKEVYEIGDCMTAGDTLRGAIESGYQVGSTI